MIYYNQVNNKKKEIGSALGICTLIPLSLGYNLTKKKKKDNVRK